MIKEIQDAIVPIRRNQPFLVGEKVHIGTSSSIFMIKNLGLCGPRETEIGPRGILKNASEFVQVAVP